MTSRQHEVIARTAASWTKACLVDWLIDHGTIYPTRREMLTWSKDELVREVVEQTIERCTYLGTAS